jgi:hypothetical protein
MSFILTDGWKISAIIKFAIKKNTWMYDVRCPPCILQLRLLSYLKLKSRLQICFFLYFIYVSFMKMSISCLLKSIVSVKETLISFNNKQRRHWKWTLCYGKCWPNFLSQATNFQQSELLIYIFSFLLHKIIVLIFNMFIYAKVGHSKFVEMHRDSSDFYRSALVFYTRHQVNITIYPTVYLQTDMCKR